MANLKLTKERIFEDIQEIRRTDYAGGIDKKGINHPENYRIRNDTTDNGNYGLF